MQHRKNTQIHMYVPACKRTSLRMKNVNEKHNNSVYLLIRLVKQVENILKQQQQQQQQQ